MWDENTNNNNKEKKNSLQSLISWFAYQIEFIVGHLYEPFRAEGRNSTHTATDWNSDQTPIQLLEVECFEQ